MEYQVPSSALSLLSRLWDAGFEAYLVGGCVRDLLRGKEPADYDMTTSATPEEMKTVFASDRVIETGIKHGTLTVLSSGISYEITTYRVDGTYTDSRHPDAVSFTRSLTEDLARRDFTINAMAYAPGKGIVDPFDGTRDLHDKIIRAVGDPYRRFSEDALRILRALRFSSVLGYKIEENTAKAAFALAKTIAKVSSERIRVELCKLICGSFAKEILLNYRDALVCSFEAFGALGEKYRDAVNHAVSLSENDAVLRLAAMLSPLGVDKAKRALLSLRFDNKSIDRVCRVIPHLFEPLPKDDAELLRLLSVLDESGVRDLLVLSEFYFHESVARLRDRLDAFLREGRCYRIRDLKINGEDLIASGFQKGKEIGAILASMLDAVISGKIENEYSALLQYAKQMKK